MNNNEAFIRQIRVSFECVFPAVVLRVVFTRIDLYRHHRRLDQAVRLRQERSVGQEEPGIPQGRGKPRLQDGGPYLRFGS